MRSNTPCFCLVILFLVCAGSRAADKRAPAAGETAAEKLRKALDQVRDLEFTDQPLDVAVNQLREQTGINFVIDQANVVLAPPLLGGQLPGAGINPTVPSPYVHLRIGGQYHGLPVRAALAKMLRNHGLAHVLVGDTVLITTADKAVERQLRQPVSVESDGGKALGDLLRRLARQTGANIVLDPKTAKEGGLAPALRLDEVPLESAVEVMAAGAGLGVARLGNVLYVTSEARAEKLRKSQPTAAAPPAGAWQVWPDGKGGFNLTPPASVGIIGLAGMGGIGGVAGLGAGGFNLMGAVGGVARPVPLTPPLPGAKPKDDKPRDAKPAPPAKPAAAPAGKDKPAPADKPQPQAIRPRSGTTRSRRRLPGGPLA